MSDQIKNQRGKKIMFSGGGTGGSVTPLLAVAEELLKDESNLEIVFVGTQTGLERGMIKNAGIRFIPIISGKWRRYFSWQNFLDIFKLGIAYFQALGLLAFEKPAIVVSAGSFVSVPLVWAAATRHIPILIHQQDVRPGLANKLMAPYARVISVTFEKSLADYGPKAVLSGNPLKNLEQYRGRSGEIRNKYNLESTRPVVVIMGGGTGATAINELVFKAVSRLTEFCQIIHLVGPGKKPAIALENNHYQIFEFLNYEELLPLLASADLVVSRAGLGALTELAALRQAVILIPLPHSHQEDNAAWLAREAAAIVLAQKDLNPEKLTVEIKRVLNDSVLRGQLSKNIGKIIKRGAAETIAGLIGEIVGK